MQIRLHKSNRDLIKPFTIAPETNFGHVDYVDIRFAIQARVQARQQWE